MATAKLTKTVVEAAEKGARDAYLWDSALPRFGARITPAGTRLYLVQYRARTLPGEPPRTRRITIGEHGRPWTVDKAREEARTLLAQVDLNRDPFAEHAAAVRARRADEDAAAAAKREAVERDKNTFALVVDRYVALKAKCDRSWEETERLIRHGPVAEWKARHVADITRADVADLIDRIGARSASVGRATYAVLRPLFAWCLERGLIDRSPCEGMRAPPRPAARERVLSDDELQLVWRAAGKLGHPFGPVIQLLMLTGQRRSEVAGMLWSEIDRTRSTWAIPAARTKNGRDHEVDLSDESLAVLAKLPSQAGEELFTARGGGAARGFSAVKRRLDALILADLQERDPEAKPLADWVIHDLRRTAATGMAALGFQPHVIERVLNHVSGAQGGLVGVYQRHTYRPERRAALIGWGAHVAEVVSGEARASNVVRSAPR